jgi:hypothetical protein
MKKKEEKEKNCLLAKGNHEEKRGKGKEQLARFNQVPLVFQAIPVPLAWLQCSNI